MKFRVLFCFVLLVGLSQIYAQSDTLRVKEHDVKIVGTSTLHDWTVEVKDVEGYLVLDAGVENSTSVKFSSNTMVSGRGATMDGKVKKALKSETHPFITFQSNSISANGNLLTVKGNLVIGGVARTIEMEVMKNGSHSYETNEKITFSQFEIEPPSAMFGTIKCGENLDIIITIKFE